MKQQSPHEFVSRLRYKSPYCLYLCGTLCECVYLYVYECVYASVCMRVFMYVKVFTHLSDTQARATCTGRDDRLYTDRL